MDRDRIGQQQRSGDAALVLVWSWWWIEDVEPLFISVDASEREATLHLNAL